MGLSIPTTYLVYIPSIPLSSNCTVVKQVCACALVSRQCFVGVHACDLEALRHFYPRYARDTKSVPLGF